MNGDQESLAWLLPCTVCLGESIEDCDCCFVCMSESCGCVDAKPEVRCDMSKEKEGSHAWYEGDDVAGIEEANKTEKDDIPF